MAEMLLAMVPLLLLVVALLLGRYPGCEAILGIAQRLAARPRHRSAEQPARPRPPRSHAAGGGLLIALGHAQRPPPLTA